MFWFKQYLHLRAVLMISEGRFAGIWPGLRDHNASSCPHAQLLETTQMVLTPGFCDFFDHRLGEGGAIGYEYCKVPPCYVLICEWVVHKRR